MPPWPPPCGRRARYRARVEQRPHARWTVWRQDDNGARFRVAAYADRVGALARLLGLEAGLPHKQLYWIDGPPGAVTCRHAADVADRIAALAVRRTCPAPGPTSRRCAPSPHRSPPRT